MYGFSVACFGSYTTSHSQAYKVPKTNYYVNSLNVMYIVHVHLRSEIHKCHKVYDKPKPLNLKLYPHKATLVYTGRCNNKGFAMFMYICFYTFAESSWPCKVIKKTSELWHREEHSSNREHVTRTVKYSNPRGRTSLSYNYTSIWKY